MDTLPSHEADRIALTNMFKAIAAYGRKVRLRRQLECEKVVPQELSDPNPDLHSHPPRRRKKREPLKK